MANTQYTTEQLARRFIDQREIQNVMGKYVFTTMICKHADVVERFWSKKAEQPVLGVNNGWYVGLEAIDGYYKAIAAQTAVKTERMQALFPKQLGDKTPEEAYGAGVMYTQPLTTPIVEVAEDGQTAKGLWQVMGLDSNITEYGPLSTWRWGWMAADFVLEDDEWKVWHLQDLQDLAAPAGTDWTKEPGYPVLEGFASLQELTLPAPTQPCELYPAYRTDRPFTEPPAVPQPYRTFADTFSYGN